MVTRDFGVMNISMKPSTNQNAALRTKLNNQQVNERAANQNKFIDYRDDEPDMMDGLNTYDPLDDTEGTSQLPTDPAIHQRTL